MILQSGPASFLMLADGPTDMIRFPSMATASDSGCLESSVQILPLTRINVAERACALLAKNTDRTMTAQQNIRHMFQPPVSSQCGQHSRRTAATPSPNRYFSCSREAAVPRPPRPELAGYGLMRVELSFPIG